jgi:hypothetical protein
MGILARIFKGNEKPLCRRPWFDPQSFSDQKLTTYRENQQPLEVDSMDSLKITQIDSFSPWNRFVVYQQWGDEALHGGRYYHWLDKKTAGLVAKTINGGPTKNIIFLCTMFEPGAIRYFADILLNGSSRNEQAPIDMLGLFWCFNGASVTDEPENVEDIAYTIDRMQLKRLSILTGHFDNEFENALADRLLDKNNTSLEHFGVFQKDDSYQWPRFPTPRMDAMVGMNRNI